MVCCTSVSFAVHLSCNNTMVLGRKCLNTVTTRRCRGKKCGRKMAAYSFLAYSSCICKSFI